MSELLSSNADFEQTSSDDDSHSSASTNKTTTNTTIIDEESMHIDQPKSVNGDDDDDLDKIESNSEVCLLTHTLLEEAMKLADLNETFIREIDITKLNEIDGLLERTNALEFSNENIIHENNNN